MSTALTIPKQAVQTYNSAPADVRMALETSLYPGADPVSIGLVLSYCQARKMDPLLKPVHIVPMTVKIETDAGTEYVKRDVIMPGIGLYRIQAEQSGTHISTSEPEFGPDRTLEFTRVVWTGKGKDRRSSEEQARITYPEWCRVTVRKVMANGMIGEFTAREYWLENYATASRDSDVPNEMWARRARGQLAKCAEAQALRRAYPAIASAPTADEMDGHTISGGRGRSTRDDEETGRAPAGSVITVTSPDEAVAKMTPKDMAGHMLEGTDPAIVEAIARRILSNINPRTEKGDDAVARMFGSHVGRDNSTDVVRLIETYGLTADPAQVADALTLLSDIPAEGLAAYLEAMAGNAPLAARTIGAVNGAKKRLGVE